MKSKVNARISKMVSAAKALCGAALAIGLLTSLARPMAAEAQATPSTPVETAAPQRDLEIEHFAKRALQVARTRAQNKNSAGFEFQRRRGTDYAGLWAGRYILVQANCTGFTSSFLFRHHLQMMGNQVALSTSHDGTLRGMTRNGGRRVEVATEYVRSNNRYVQAVVIYDKNSGSSAATGLGVRVSGPFGSCVAGYGANAIRQFGF
jgi:hypothetical protein